MVTFRAPCHRRGTREPSGTLCTAYLVYPAQTSAVAATALLSRTVQHTGAEAWLMRTFKKSVRSARELSRPSGGRFPAHAAVLVRWPVIVPTRQAILLLLLLPLLLLFPRNIHRRRNWVLERVPQGRKRHPQLYRVAAHHGIDRPPQQPGRHPSRATWSMAEQPARFGSITPSFSSLFLFLPLYGGQEREILRSRGRRLGGGRACRRGPPVVALPRRSQRRLHDCVSRGFTVVFAAGRPPLEAEERLVPRVAKGRCQGQVALVDHGYANVAVRPPSPPPTPSASCLFYSGKLRDELYWVASIVSSNSDVGSRARKGRESPPNERASKRRLRPAGTGKEA